MLCAAHALVQRGEANILAVVHDTGLPSGVGALSAINEFWRRGNIMLGGYHGSVGSPDVSWSPDWVRDGRGVYVEDLVNTFKPNIHNFDQPWYSNASA